MPIIQSGAKVLVTGCNGYIGMQTVSAFLEHGYHVRGTVRSQQKAQSVLECFPEYAKEGKLEVFVVGDLLKEGVFDDAVKSVEGVVHTATPLGLSATSEPIELIQPAVQGTLSVLESALRHSTSIKRIVFVESISTISQVSLDAGDVHRGNPNTAVRAFTEQDWNERSVSIIERFGKDAPPIDKYQASKFMAEKAAWKFVEEHKHEIGWDIVTTHPGYVFGPFVNKWNTPAVINESSQMWYGVIFSTNTETLPFLSNSNGGYVDVRDVSLANVRALERPEAGGERFILTSDEAWIWNDFNDVANDLVPAPKLNTPIAPKRNLTRECLYLYDHSKAQRILGINFRGKEEITRDTLEDWAKKGW